jgi:hypothetical protein
MNPLERYEELRLLYFNRVAEVAALERELNALEEQLKADGLIVTNQAEQPGKNLYPLLRRVTCLDK